MIPATNDGGASVTVLRDVPFGEASTGHGSDHPGTRLLTLDVYLPTETGAASARPALVLSHGGAYHRGSKETDEFEQEGSRNTPVPEYCERFAAKGFVCFSVGYRLTQELAAPQPQAIRRSRAAVSRGRIDYVRELLGLPLATDEELLNGVEGAIADVADAFRFVQVQASRWNVDPSRIALGGFSAGAFSSIYAAYALGVPAAAIVSLSGGMDPEDADHYLHGGRGQPPVLLFSSEFDLPGIGERTLALAHRAETLGLGVRRYAVPGKPHFYDRRTEVVLEASSLPGGLARCTVESAIEDFLQQSLAPAAVDLGKLEAFAQAWNRHDIEGLMTFMSDDCVFHGSAGIESCGSRHVGPAAVRAAFVKAWTDFPDAQWTRARHVVCGQRGLSEWTFVGTRASDGLRIEVDGCDLFTFSGQKIRVKDSWRKARSLTGRPRVLDTNPPLLLARAAFVHGMLAARCQSRPSSQR